MEMGGKHVVLFIVGLSCTLHWSLQASRGQGASEGLRSGQGQAFLLAFTSQKMLDRSSTAPAQFAANTNLCSMRVRVEEIDHILLSSDFSQQVWSTALGVLSLDQMLIKVDNSFWSWWLKSCKMINKDFRRGFDSFTFLVGWHL
jgi:hypothetical protein